MPSRYGAIEDVGHPEASPAASGGGGGGGSSSGEAVESSSPQQQLRTSWQQLQHRIRRASRASSARTPITLVPAAHDRPDLLTQLIISQYDVLPTSAALQELDLSAAPIGLDMPDEDPKSFRRQTLLSLDLLRGALLALLALESIQLFLRSEQESDENWYSKQDRWTESPLYALRLLANPAAPGLFCLAGAGVVLFQQSRLQLGWSRFDLLRHFAVRGASLMLIQLALSYDFAIQEDGPNLIENLILWTYGLNLILLGACVVGLHTLERYFIQRRRASHERARKSEGADVSGISESDPFIDDARTYDAELEQARDEAAEKAEVIAHYTGNAVALVIAAALLAMNMLAVPRQGTQPGDRSGWFWFWAMPMPTSIADMWRAYGKIMSQYTPLNWLPFGLLGIVYARFLTRRHRSTTSLCLINLSASLLLLTLFVLTRILKFGNLSASLLPAHPRHPNNPYLESWQAFLYTVKFPPDLAYSSLSLGVVGCLFSVCLCIKTEWKERLPLLRFGRTPIFFYAAQLLVFRFVSGFALTFFGLPSRLDLAPALTCYFGTLFIVWFISKGFLAFKEARSSPDSLWRFF